MDVEPVVTAARTDELTVRSLLGYRRHDPDSSRDGAQCSVDVHSQVGMDVIGDLLAGLAPDAVDRLPRPRGALRGKQGALFEDDALGPDRPGEDGRRDVSGSVR
jgi:hypothetical protein